MVINRSKCLFDRICSRLPYPSLNSYFYWIFTKTTLQDWTAEEYRKALATSYSLFFQEHYKWMNNSVIERVLLNFVVLNYKLNVIEHILIVLTLTKERPFF